MMLKRFVDTSYGFEESFLQNKQNKNLLRWISKSKDVPLTSSAKNFNSKIEYHKVRDYFFKSEH